MDRQQHLKEAVRMTLEQSKSPGLAEDILQKVVAEALRAYQSKIHVGVQDSITDLLDGFKHKVTDTILEASENWHVPQREPILFPKNCKFLYQRGKTTVVVMEEPPQCRTLQFSKSVIESNYDDSYDQIEPLYLSLPYVVFVIVFQNNVFNSMNCAFRKTELTSLEDDLGKSLLPNIHGNLNVCMGSFALQSSDSITVRSEKAVHWFWTSVFNKDLAERWDTKHLIDSRLIDGYAWQDLSREDPFFILSVPFSQSNQTIRNIMELSASREEEPDESNFRHRLSESIERCSEEMFKRVLVYFKKTKFERHIPKDVSTSVQTVISNVMDEVADLMVALQEQVDELQAKTEKRKFEARSQYWT